MRFGDNGIESNPVADVATNTATGAVGGAISLSKRAVKGEKINLTKDAPSLHKVRIGLGWDVQKRDGQDADLDVMTFLLGDNQKCTRNEDFVFYGNPNSADGSVAYGGDNQTGEDETNAPAWKIADDGSVDDETIEIDLDKVDAKYKFIRVVISIYDADARKQNFGMVTNARARLVDMDTEKQLYHIDLSEDASLNTVLVVLDLYRHNGDWKMTVVEEGYKEGLIKLGAEVGLQLVG